MKIKRLITLLLVFTMLFTFFPFSHSVVMANPYPQYNYYNSASDYQISCTWYAWKMANEKMGVSLPSTLGNALTWYSNARSAGYSVGSTPKANSIAVWNTPSPWGHVAYVTGVNANGSFNIVEGGSAWPGATAEGICSRTVSHGTYWPELGFIYLDGNSSAPSAPAVSYANITSGKYFIKNNGTGKYLCVGASGSSNNIWVWERNGYTYEFEMEIQNAGSGYKIRPTCSSGLVNVYADYASSGCNVTVLQDVNDSTQWWYFQPANGGYAIKSANNEGVCLSIDSSGYNVIVSSYNGSSDQIWSLESVAPAHTHNYDQKNTDGKYLKSEADCTLAAEYYYSCSCGEKGSNTFTSGNALGHSYQESTYISDNGGQSYKEFKCSLCGNSYKEEIYEESKTEVEDNPEEEPEEYAEQYWLFYDANGGVGAPAPIEKTEGSRVSITSKKPTRNGYTFVGWSENAGAYNAEYKNGSKITIDRNITLYAIWERNSGTADNTAPSDWAATDVKGAIDAGLVPQTLQKNYTMPVYRLEVAEMFIDLIEEASGKQINTILRENGVSRNNSVFTDTTDENVLAANALGIIKGVGNKMFDCYGTLTRAEITAIINRTAKVLGINTSGYTHSFADVQGHWCNEELGWASSVGIINGVGDRRFAPDEKLTTEQAIAISYRAYQKITANDDSRVKYTPTLSKEYDGHIYFLYDYEMSWTEAKALCEKMGGHLATVSDDVEGFVIKSVISEGKSDAYWLGATSDGSADGNFRWITGESFTYTDWEKDEPSNTEQDGDKEMYLEVRKSYSSKWNDVINSNYYDKGFILEIDK